MEQLCPFLGPCAAVAGWAVSSREEREPESMGEACCARAGTFEVCRSLGRRVVRQTTALAPGTKGPVEVTGGDQGRTFKSGGAG